MALNKWLNSDLWSVLASKTDTWVDALNVLTGGTTGQRLVKSSSTDFDFEYSSPELLQTSTTSVDLSTVVIGAGFVLDIPYCSYNINSNLRLKCYSASSTSNYVIGTVYGVSGGLTVSISVEKVSGTATVNDWVIVQYFDEYSKYDTGVVTVLTSNTLIDSVTIGTNGTLGSYSLHAIKKGNLINLSGYILVNVSGGNFNSIALTLKQKYYIKSGGSIDYHFPCSVAQYTTSGGGDKVGTSGNITNTSNSTLNISTNQDIPTAKTCIVYLDINYQSDNLD